MSVYNGIFECETTKLKLYNFNFNFALIMVYTKSHILCLWSLASVLNKNYIIIYILFRDTCQTAHPLKKINLKKNQVLPHPANNMNLIYYMNFHQMA